MNSLSSGRLYIYEYLKQIMFCCLTSHWIITIRLSFFMGVSYSRLRQETENLHKLDRYQPLPPFYVGIGGIVRHDRLWFYCRKACGLESHVPTQFMDNVAQWKSFVATVETRFKILVRIQSLSIFLYSGSSMVRAVVL